MTAFQGHCAAEAGGLLFFPAGGTDLPVAAGDTGYERGVTFEAPYVSAGEAEPYGCIRDAFDPGTVHRARVPAMRAGANGPAANRSFSGAVLFDGQQKGILKIIRKKFPHSQKSARQCLTHGKPLPVVRLELQEHILSQIEATREDINQNSFFGC